MSAVYEGRDVGLGGTAIAIKVMHTAEPDLAHLLAGEFAILSGLHHPHLPRARTFGSLTADTPLPPHPQGAAYLIEELCPGIEASAWALGQPAAQVAAVGAQMAAALAVLHANGLCHGDIKPGNILVTSSPWPWARLIDFSLAARGRKSSVSGTFRYMAPEALGGAREERSDIYSLGATLAELLGQPPGDRPGVQRRPAALTDLVAALTEPEVSRRPRSVEAFALLVAACDGAAREHLEMLADQTVSPWQLCEREAALLPLRAALEPRTHGARIVRWVGAPGSGRSALLVEALAQAALAGWQLPNEILPAAHGSLAPAWQALNLTAPPASDAAASQWSVYTSWTEAAAQVCQNGAIAVAFDDVPAASPLAQLGAFLERLGDRAPAVTWFETSHRSTLAHVPLTALSTAGVSTMLERARPLRPVDATTAPELWRATGGNPGMLLRLLNALPGDALLQAAQQGNLAPERLVAESVATALAELDEACQDAVRTVAWLPPPVADTLLTATLKTAAWSAPTELERALHLGLLERRATPHGVAFATPSGLVRAALCAQTPPRLLRSLANALAETKEAPRCASELGKIYLALGAPREAATPLLAGAEQATRESRHPDAVALLRAALETHALTAAQERDAQIRMGRAQLQMGQLAEATASFQAAAPHPESRVCAAEAAIARGGYAEASTLLQTVPPPPNEDQGRADALLAKALVHQGRYADALTTIAAAQARGAPHPHRLELAGLQALCALYQGNTPSALQQIREVQHAALQSGDARLLDWVRGHHALIAQKAADLSAAERAYEASLAWARETHDLPRQLSRLTNLGTLRQEQGAFDHALAAYEEAAHLATLIEGDREALRIALNRANLLCFLGDHRAARAVLDAIQAAQVPGLALEQAFLTLVSAECHVLADQCDDAACDLQQARATFEEYADRTGLAECFALEANLALKRHDPAQARRLARLAIQSAQSAQRPHIEMMALLSQALAELLSPSTDVALALQGAARGLSLANDRHDPDVGWVLAAVLCRLERRAGQNPQTQQHLALARELYEQARRRVGARFEPGYNAVWYRAEQLAWIRREQNATENFSRDVDRLLAINRELAQDHDPERLLERIIDAAIALSGAERGFIILKGTDGELLIRAARNIDRATLETDAVGISQSIASQAMTAAAPIVSIDAADDERFRENLSVHNLKLRSVLSLPLRTQRGVLGALYLDNRFRVNAFSDADVALLTAFGDQAAIALANAQMLAEMERRGRELEASRAAIEALNARLETELKARATELELVRQERGEPPAATEFCGMVGKSAALREIFRIIERVADKDVPISIQGESGTGKELVARAIHSLSSRRKGAFVSINCGAIPSELLESELFGHERGAFTGAVRTKAGLFEVARGGTLFLDEIGDMPLPMQVKLLRVLQQREFRRVGGTENLATDARVLSATNQDLEVSVKQQRFREDLWFRLNVVGITVPPLRARREDLPLLVEALLKRHAGCHLRLSRPALAAILDHDWPGNVRELENEIQRAIALADGDTIGLDALSERLRKHPGSGHADGTLKEVVERCERDAIRETLAKCHGRVAAAAQELGLTRAGLYKKINKYHLAAKDD